MIESGLKDIAIAENLKQFLLVLSVSLSMATLPQVFSWFHRIPYTVDFIGNKQKKLLE